MVGGLANFRQSDFGQSIFGSGVCHGGAQRGEGARGVGPKAAGVSHDSPRAQTCTFEGPGLSNTTKSQREDTQKEREKKNENGAGEGKKKEAKFWAVRRRGVRCRAVRCKAVWRLVVQVRVQHQHQHQHQPQPQPQPHQQQHQQPHTATQHKNGLAQNGLAQNWIGQSWPNHQPLTTNFGQLAKVGPNHPNGAGPLAVRGAEVPPFVADIATITAELCARGHDLGMERVIHCWHSQEIDRTKGWQQHRHHCPCAWEVSV